MDQSGAKSTVPYPVSIRQRTTKDKCISLLGEKEGRVHEGGAVPKY
eukprot:SAG11_NODE_27423_length_332_cov_10.609442_1_plen_45_part_10